MKKLQSGSLAALTVLALSFAVAPPAAQAQTYSVVYNFGSQSNDPSGPAYSGAIAQGRDGNLYSTAPSGGVDGQGGIFKITPAGAITLLYSFDGTQGSSPSSGLTLGTDGNFYGTTFSQGTGAYGTAYKITPAGVLSVLWNFTGGSDGANPYAPPVQGTDGNWYGTTSGGANSACFSGCGTVYKLTPSGTLTTLYQFDITHGYAPRAPLVLGADGNFYGTTLYGGTSGPESGVVFKISTSGKLTVLYNFDNTHGGLSTSPLIQGTDGNFYGTTEDGGSVFSGVAFKMTPTGTLTVLHSMNDATDGAVPAAGLLQASDGNFYGVNSQPGSSPSSGMLFELTAKNVFSVLHNFDGTDGSTPQVTPFQHTNGLIYGDTASGGTGNVSPCSTGLCGVFYSLNIAAKPFVTLVTLSGKVGSKIGILGQGFTSASVVKFNGVQVTSLSRSGSTFISAAVPAGATDGFVTVTTGTTTLTSSQKFIVHNSWSSGKVMPTAVLFPATGEISGKIYVVGGLSSSALIGTNQVYNPTANTWTTAAAEPTPVSGAASAVVDNLLYVIGGYTTTSSTATNQVQVYNPKTNTWATKSAMLTARGSTAAVVDGTAIFVIGGNGSTNRLNTVEKYVTTTDTWTEEAPLLVGKSEPAAGLLGPTIVAVGGYTTSEDTGDNEGYTVSTNKWAALTLDATPRNGSCFATLSGLLYVAGGGDNGAPQTVNESFRATTNTWTTLAPMPQAVIAPGSAVAGGLLYCIGGSSTGTALSGTVYNNVQIYQP